MSFLIARCIQYHVLTQFSEILISEAKRDITFEDPYSLHVTLMASYTVIEHARKLQ